MEFKKIKINKKTNKKIKTKSMTYELISWYTTLFLSVVILTVFFIVFLVAVFMYNDVENDIDKMEKQIALNSNYESENLPSFLENVLYPFNPSIMLKIENANGTSAFYSRDWQESLDSITNLGFFHNIFYDDENIYYGDTISLSSGDTLKIYTNINNIREFLYLLIKIGAIVVFGTLTIGLVFIFRKTRKIISPIDDLANSVINLNLHKDLHKGVPVPKSPKEVKNLGDSFNGIMKELDYYIENEKKFVSNASHELRNPVAGILGNINLIIRRGKEHPDIMEKSLTAIQEEALRMEKLLEQLLKMARLENFDNDMKTLDLSNILTTFFEKNFKLTKDLKLELEICDDCIIRGNKDLIIQAVTILLDNGQKYSEEGDKIKVVLSKNEKECILEVKDTGIGIPKEDLGKIFGRFYRVDKNRSRSTGGTGLGLAMAKEIIDIHKGEIEVFSELGMGTLFKITLKCVK